MFFLNISQLASVKLSIESPSFIWMQCQHLIGAWTVLQPSLFTLAAHLLGFAELLHYFGSHLKVLQQVIGHGVSDPRGPLGRPELQQLVPSLLVRVDARKQQQRFSSLPSRSSSRLCCVTVAVLMQVYLMWDQWRYSDLIPPEFVRELRWPVHPNLDTLSTFFVGFCEDQQAAGLSAPGGARWLLTGSVSMRTVPLVTWTMLQVHTWMTVFRGSGLTGYH